MQQRKAVVLTARVHPGETNASWMMKGFLDFLLSGSKEAKVGNACRYTTTTIYLSIYGSLPGRRDVRQENVNI